jgi:hypothetical protein
LEAVIWDLAAMKVRLELRIGAPDLAAIKRCILQEFRKQQYRELLALENSPIAITEYRSKIVDPTMFIAIAGDANTALKALIAGLVGILMAKGSCDEGAFMELCAEGGANLTVPLGGRVVLEEIDQVVGGFLNKLENGRIDRVTVRSEFTQ